MYFSPERPSVLWSGIDWAFLLSNNYIAGTSFSREGSSTSPADADLDKFPGSCIQGQAGFSESPHTRHSGGGKSYNLQRHHQPYSRGGRSHKSPASHQSKWLEPHTHTLIKSKECVNHIIVHLTQQELVKPQTAQLSLCVARRLSNFHMNWKVITSDKWVLDTVEGFWIPFTNPPVQEHWPSPPMFSTEQSSLLRRGEHSLEKGEHY